MVYMLTFWGIFKVNVTIYIPYMDPIGIVTIYIPYMDPIGIVNSWIFDTPTPDVERFNMIQPYISVVWALQLCFWLINPINYGHIYHKQ